MTIRACVIGWPVEQSRSPLIHRYWLEQHGIDGRYTREPVAPQDLDAFVAAMRERGFAGCNVTVPHKERVLGLAHMADDDARAIGAANTLWFETGRLHAANTDAYGFLANLDAGAPGWDGNGAAALVLGAGGAARAVIHGLIRRGFEDIRLANRTGQRARALARHFGGPVHVVDWDRRATQTQGCALIVNTTTLGMSGQAPLELDLSAADGNTVVTDLVYAPLMTGLLERAAERGLRSVDGLGMLLHQAAPGFQKWFGVRPEVTPELRALVAADLETR
jgi:shikimate dehydrogenase